MGLLNWEFIHFRLSPSHGKMRFRGPHKNHASPCFFNLLYSTTSHYNQTTSSPNTPHFPFLFIPPCPLSHPGYVSRRESSCPLAPSEKGNFLLPVLSASFLLLNDVMIVWLACLQYGLACAWGPSGSDLRWLKSLLPTWRYPQTCAWQTGDFVILPRC